MKWADNYWIKKPVKKKSQNHKGFPCPECGEKFSSYDEARQHSWYCGKEEKLRLCPYCGSAMEDDEDGTALVCSDRRCMYRMRRWKK